MHQVPSIT